MNFYSNACESWRILRELTIASLNEEVRDIYPFLWAETSFHGRLLLLILLLQRLFLSVHMHYMHICIYTRASLHDDMYIYVYIYTFRASKITMFVREFNVKKQIFSFSFE